MLTDRTWVSLLVGDQYSNIGGNSFRNRINIQPSISRRLADWLTAELSYEYAYSEYYFPTTTSALDRDGDSHTLSMLFYFKVPNTDLLGRIGYIRRWVQAQGSDFDYGSDGFIIGLMHPLPWGMTGEITYARL